MCTITKQRQFSEQTFPAATAVISDSKLVRERQTERQKKREIEGKRTGTLPAVLFNCLSDTQSPWLPSGRICVCVCV